MARYWSIVLLLAIMLSTSGCANPPGSITTKEQIQQHAEEFMLLLSSGEYDQARSYFDSNLQQALPEERLAYIWESLAKRHGIYLRIRGSEIEENSDYYIAYITCLFQKNAVNAKIVINHDGKIAGLFFKPVNLLPDVPEGTFVEEEIEIIQGDLSLPGVFTRPAVGDDFPAIVFVHNSMTQDRDGSFGPNKVLRDLAWELAAQGIASLRFDKRSFVYPDYFVNNYDYTIEDAIILDAVAALNTLKAYESIDSSRVFVLGHGIGGNVSPRIALQVEGIRGVILLAALARSVDEAMMDQYNYLFGLSEFLTEEEESLLQSVKKEIDLLNEICLGQRPITKRMILGLPVSYWLDLKEYQPQEYLVKTENLSFLVLQGGRDYQVTVEDFELWRDYLHNRDSEFHFYDDLNHLFMSGQGDIVPLEYLIPNNVSKIVVDDIVEWVGYVSGDKEE